MAVAMLNDTAVSSVLIYFFVYMLMNLGAFLVVQVVADKAGTENIDDYSGMGYRNPLIGVALTILLISLTGLPPTAGFIGKLYVFSAVVNAGWLWLAAIGVLNSVVSLYYYAKVIRNMYLRDVESKKSKLTVSPVVMGLILALAALTLVFGLYFSPMINWANSSVQILSGF
jgi:NADH-quinone oxidoreductase subunit N